MQTIGVKLQFTADTTAARKSMQDLQSQLTKLSQMNASTAPGVQMSKDLAQASVEAEKLKVSLQAAFNTNTGRLDLGKFRQALAQSGTSLKQVQATLTSLGPAGQQAFSSLATKIITAEQPALRLNATMKKFATTLANTARYQISTRMFQAVISSVSDALSYVKELNASLNDIRIVTGLSTTAMDKFADRAAKAAKALSSTTNELVKASLIYFQQGLDEDAAMARAEITVKMANVTGEAAEQVSEKLTAIWNNFYDGSKSLEYYADVITALGAATASSTDEIAQGLEKFAAVAETVGLSYEYATTALATVTAETRQSADVVGTAFKTLFARLQDLELGNTLDDGTSLGSYSQALMAVGINIKQANGELKDMDSILNEMGAKWETLSSDQQVALAQNVAGVRQYTQLIALMDNWETFQINLEVAESAEGTLQSQQNIYAEGWEAASQRVTASVQEIYDKLLDDDFFISLTEGFAKFIDTIGTIIDSLGGLKGILMIVGTVFLNTFQDKIAGALSTAQAGITTFGKKALKVVSRGRYQPKDENATMQQDAISGLQRAYGDSAIGKSQTATTQELINVNQNLLKYKNQLTEAEKLAYEMAVDRLTVEHDNVQQAAEEAKLREKTARAATEQKSKSMAHKKTVNVKDRRGEKKTMRAQNAFDEYAIKSTNVGAQDFLQTNVLSTGTSLNAAFKGGVPSDTSAASTQLDDMISRLTQLGFGVEEVDANVKNLFGDEESEQLNKYTKALKEMKSALDDIKKAEKDQKRYTELTDKKNKAGGKLSKKEEKELKRLEQTQQQGAQAQQKYTEAKEKYTTAQREATEAVTDTGKAMKDTANRQKNLEEGLRKVDPNISQFGDHLKDVAGNSLNAQEGLHQVAEKSKAVGTGMEESATKVLGFSQRLAATGTALMAAGSVFSSVQGFFDNLTAPDTSPWEKFVSFLTTLGVMIPMVTMAINAQNVAKMMGITLTEGETIALKIKQGTETKGLAGMIARRMVQKNLNGDMAIGIAVTLAYVAAVALLALGVMGLVSLFSDNTEAEQKAAEKAMEAAQANQELIDSSAELTDTLQGLIDTYDSLAQSQQSTYETMKDIKKQFPELIASYRDLQDSLGIKLDLSALEAAYDKFTQTGDIEDLKKRIAEIEQKLNIETQEQQEDIALNAGIKTQKWIEQELNDAGYEGSRLILENNTIDSGAWMSSAGIANQLGDLQLSKDQMKAFTADEGLLDTFMLDESSGNYILDANALEKQGFTSASAVWKLILLKFFGTDPDNKIGYLKLNQGMSDYDFVMADPRDEQSTRVMYELLSQAMALGRKIIPPEALTEVNGYKQIQKIFDKQGDTIQTQKDATVKISTQAEQAAATDDQFFTSTGDSGLGLGLNPEDINITDSTGYEDIRPQLIDSLINAGYAADDEDAARFLRNSAQYGDYEKEYQVFNSEKLRSDIAQRVGVSSDSDYVDNYILEIKNAVAELGPEAQQALGLADFASTEGGSAKERIQQAINEMRAGAARTEVEQLAEAEELNLELIYKQAEHLQAIAKNTVETEAEAIRLSGTLFRAQKGVNALVDGWEDWQKLLANTGDVLLPDQQEAVVELAEAFEDLFNLTDAYSQLGTEFFLQKDIQELLQIISEGGAEAEQAMRDLSASVAIRLAENTGAQFEGDINKLITSIANDTTLNIGAELNTAPFMQDLADLLIKTGVSVADMQAIFNSLGWNPEIEMKKFSADATVDNQGYITEDGITTYVGAGVQSGTEIELPVFKNSAGKTNLTSSDISASYTPSSFKMPSISPKSNGGGKSKKELKVLDEEIERYHQISELLDDLKRQYGELSERKDRAFGASHFGYLEAEKEQLDKIIQAQKDYVSEIEGYLATDKEALLQYGATLDEEGRIINYEELMRVNVESYNKAAEKFNAGQMSEEQFAEYEKAYEKFLKDMEQYEETLNLLEDEQQTLFEKQNERFDKSLEKAEYIVELGTGLIEDSLEIIEYQLNKIDDEAYEAAEAMSLIGSKMAETMKKQNIYKQAIAETLGASGLTIDDILNLDSTQLQELVNNGTFTAEQVEQLRDYRNGLLELNEEMNDLADEGIETVISAFDAWDEKFYETTEKFEHLSNTVQSYRDIIDLVGKDTLNVSDDMLDTLNQMTVSMSQNSLKTAKAQLEANKSNLQKAREELMQATNETERKRWQQIIDDLEVRVREGEETVFSSWQDALQATTDAFEDALERIGQAFEDAAAGIYESLDALQSAYDQRTQISERYVADYTKIYELSKLTRDITKSMDESDSIRAKSKLRDLQEEIYALQASGAEMTEYEVNELRARYELRLAEIALEEAQNAKSQVRMSRDSEGNWSYVYTADEEATATAAQAYEDQLYKYQQLTQDYTKELQDQLLALPATAKEAITELMQNTALTEEQKEARKAELVEFYTSQYNYILSELERANADSRSFYETDWLQYSEISGYKISVNEKWIDSFNETVYAELTGFSTLEEAQSAFTSSLQTFSENASSVFTQWHNNVAAIMQLAGSSVETFADTLSASIAQVYQDSKTYQQEIEDISKDMDENTEGLFTKAEEIWKKYAEHVNNGATANEQLAQSINNVIGAIAVATGPLDTLKNKYWAIQQAAAAAAVQIAIVNGSGVPEISPTDLDGENLAFESYQYNATTKMVTSSPYASAQVSYADINPANWGLVGEYLVEETTTRGVARAIKLIDYINAIKASGEMVLPEFDRYSVFGFDTGGYTGSWDASGRLAMLHQKEIVLNAHDTENFLSAVNIVRDIAKVIDLNASAQSGLFSLISSMTVAPSTQTIEQEVTIHAEFPNATDHSEIEEAFNTLINRASQFANRKN